MKIEAILDKIDKEFKGKAITDDMCLYITDCGKKCAIGLFIPDGHKAQKAVGVDAEDLIKAHPDLKKYMPNSDVEKLNEFQETHDFSLLRGMTLDEQKEILKEKAIELFS